MSPLSGSMYAWRKSSHDLREEIFVTWKIILFIRVIFKLNIPDIHIHFDEEGASVSKIFFSFSKFQIDYFFYCLYNHYCCRNAFYCSFYYDQRLYWSLLLDWYCSIWYRLKHSFRCLWDSVVVAYVVMSSPCFNYVLDVD